MSKTLFDMQVPGKPLMSSISLFSGVGGLDLGLRRQAFWCDSFIVQCGLEDHVFAYFVDGNGKNLTFLHIPTMNEWVAAAACS